MCVLIFVNMCGMAVVGLTFGAVYVGAAVLTLIYLAYEACLVAR
jgi:hypothetical protein